LTVLKRSVRRVVTSISTLTANTGHAIVGNLSFVKGGYTKNLPL
jgi:hypothetical protein